MSWSYRNSNRYFYHSRRHGARKEAVYFGSGLAAEAMAAQVEQRRAARAANAAARRRAQARAQAIDLLVAEGSVLIKALVDAALLASGHHQLDRKWYRRHAP